jgi:hypothetical protein
MKQASQTQNSPIIIMSTPPVVGTGRTATGDIVKELHSWSDVPNHQHDENGGQLPCPRKTTGRVFSATR